ncbi:MAG: hypothetical protein AAFY65_13610 [Pseudomonadota bacterium]
MKRLLLLWVVKVAVPPVYTLALARLDLMTSPAMVATDARADRVDLDKPARRLTLRRHPDEQIPQGTYATRWHKTEMPGISARGPNGTPFEVDA